MTRAHIPLLCVLSSALVFACGDPGSISDNGGNGNGNGDGGGNGEFGDGGGELPPEACRKIDLVFSVDPSGSMSEELDAMKSVVFPQFAEALIDVGDGIDDYRVGVIDACPSPADFHTRGESSASCNFQSGMPWMTSDSSALTDEFACVGDIYKESSCSGENDDEQPIAAAIASLSGANPGFSRDDALLVVVAITDEDECPTHPDCNDTSPSRAEQIYDQLVAIKGDVRKMVLLGIGSRNGCSEADGAYGSADQSVLLNRITDLFIGESRGVFWDLCDGNLEDGLGEAIAVIDEACRNLPQVD